MPYADPKKRAEYNKIYAPSWRKRNKDKTKIYKKRARKNLIERIGIEEIKKKRQEFYAKVTIISFCVSCSIEIVAKSKRKYCAPCNRKSRIGNKNYTFVKNRLRGKDSPNWKGGRTSLRKQIRDSAEYKKWRTQVFERDNYTCVWCSSKNGNGAYVRLEGDHFPVPFAKVLDTYEITCWDEASKCEMLWDISNGRTLCVKCHNTTKNGNPKHKNKEWSGKK